MSTKNRVIDIVNIVFLNSLGMKLLGEELTSWNHYFIVNNFARPVHRNWLLILVKNLHCCQIALIIQMQNPQRSMRLITNVRLIASCAY